MSNANAAEIAEQITRLTRTLPPPRGMDMAKALPEYLRALAQFTIEEITEAVDRRLSGGFPDIRTSAYPRVPEFVDLIKRLKAEKMKAYQDALRAEQIAKESAELRMVRKKTPEELARAKELVDRFNEERDKGARERAKLVEAERRRVRMGEYGMTDEALAKIPDRPLPDGWRGLGDVADSAVTFAQVNERIDQRRAKHETVEKAKRHEEQRYGDAR
jgi:hypothetical protein